MNNEELYEKYRKLIYYVAARFRRSYGLTAEHVEDLAVAAATRLIGVPQDKRQYPAYCRTTINNAMRNELKKLLAYHDTTFSLDTSLSDDPDDNTLYKFFSDERQNPEDEVLGTMFIHDCLELLDEQAQQIVVWAVGLNDNPMSARTIAKRLGLSVDHVDQILSDAYATMRKTLQPPQQYSLLGTECGQCREIEFLLLPIGHRTPETVLCLACNHPESYSVVEISLEGSTLTI